MNEAADSVIPFFRTRNYLPVADELTAFDLPVDGVIPPQLDGWYLRNGPNPRQAGGHWFTGEGMIHGLRLQGGRACWYRNRWVRTSSFNNPSPIYRPDGTRNLRSSAANTNIVHHAGRTMALIESSLPYEITNELETLGAYDFDGKLLDSMTAHPKICPNTGELHFFGYGSLTKPYVTYHRADAAGKLTINQGIDVPALTMMHDFALTADHVVFMDLPVVFDLNLALSGESRLPYRWDDTYGARLGVLRRDDPFGPVRWFDVQPCYVFHIANAYDDADNIVLHVVRYPELWRSSRGFTCDAALWRWTIDLTAGTVSERQIDDRKIEFPRIDDRRTGLRVRYAVTVGDGALIRYDLDSDAAQEHSFRSGDYCGAPDEAVFAPADLESDELAGWYLLFVYEPAIDRSDLVIIDATDFSGAPVARVNLPRRVPHGFHGAWIPA